MKDYEDKFHGVLLGLACGDAVGRPVEGLGPDEIVDEYGTVTGMIGDGVFSAPPGTTTDDTELAVRLANSLIDNGGFAPSDFKDRLIQWRENDGFGIGRMTKRSINRLQRGEEWHKAGIHVWQEASEGSNAGNGSVMRCAPLALAYDGLMDNGESLTAASKAQSIITHADPRCVCGSVVLNRVIQSQLGDGETPLDDVLEAVDGAAPTELIDQLQSIPSRLAGNRFGLTPYVIDTLKLACHHALTASSTADAIIGAVNEGGDTDTTAAIAGAIAGARYGASSIPSEWLNELDREDELRTIADRLRNQDFKMVHEDDLPELDVRCLPGPCQSCGSNLTEYTEAQYCPHCGADL